LPLGATGDSRTVFDVVTEAVAAPGGRQQAALHGARTALALALALALVAAAGCVDAQADAGKSIPPKASRTRG